MPSRTSHTTSKWRVVAWSILGLLLTYYAVRVTIHQRPGRGPRGDWAIYYRTGVAFAQALESGSDDVGRRIYNTDHGVVLTYKYSPFYAMMLSVPARLPVMPGRLLWYLLDLALLVLLFRMAHELLGRGPPESESDDWRWRALLCCTICFFYVHTQLAIGQVTMQYLLLGIVGFVCLLRGRPLLGGVLLGLGFAVKLLPICLVPYLVFCRRGWLAAISFSATLGICFLATAAVLGWDDNWQLFYVWFPHLGEIYTPEQFYRVNNQGVQAQLARFLHETGHGVNVADLPLRTVGRIWLALAVTTAAAMYAWFFVTRDRPRVWRETTHLAVILGYMAVFNPQAWRYNFVLLLIPCFVLLRSVEIAPQRAWIRVMPLLAIPTTAALSMRDAVFLHSLGWRLWPILCLIVTTALILHNPAWYGGRRAESG